MQIFFWQFFVCFCAFWGNLWSGFYTCTLPGSSGSRTLRMQCSICFVKVLSRRINHTGKRSCFIVCPGSGTWPEAAISVFFLPTDDSGMEKAGKGISSRLTISCLSSVFRSSWRHRPSHLSFAPQFPFAAESESAHNMFVFQMASGTHFTCLFIEAVLRIQVDVCHVIDAVAAYIAPKALSEFPRRPHPAAPFPCWFARPRLPLPCILPFCPGADFYGLAL